MADPSSTLDQWLENEDDYVPYVPVYVRRGGKQKRKAIVDEGNDHQSQAKQPTEPSKHQLSSSATTASSMVHEGRRPNIHYSHGQNATDQQQNLKSISSAPQQYSTLPKRWTPPRHIRELPLDAINLIRINNYISCKGLDIPPAIKTFTEMRVLPSLVHVLKKHGRDVPEAIEMQGIPVAFSGRDLFAVSKTSGDVSYISCLAVIMTALQAETNLEFVKGEGPVGVVLCSTVLF